MQRFRALFYFGGNPVGSKALGNQTSECADVSGSAGIVVVAHGGEALQFVGLDLGSSQVSEQSCVKCSAVSLRPELSLVRILKRFQRHGAFLLVETVEIHEGYEKDQTHRHEMTGHRLDPKMKTSHQPD